MAKKVIWFQPGQGLQNIEPPEFRLRVGDYRVRFHDLGDTIEILSVRHRREAYR